MRPWHRGCKPSPTRYGGSARNFRRRLISWWIGCGSTMSARTRPSLASTMPPFVLPDETGHLVSLDSLLEKGPVAVTFHRGHWCPYCRINTRALAARRIRSPPRADRSPPSCRTASISPSSSRPSSAAPFPILTDFDNGYALSLNLAFWVGQEMQELMTRAGWDVSRRKAPTPGCCRFPPPSWWAPTARSRRASSIPTIASAWRSRISCRRSGPRTLSAA